MNRTLSGSAFGRVGLTNCERELIHLAGAAQPHGALLVVREPDLAVLQATTSADAVLGVTHAELLGRPLDALGGDLAAAVRAASRAGLLRLPVPLRCSIDAPGGARGYDGAVHRTDAGLVVELEPQLPALAPAGTLPHLLAAAVGEVSAAVTLDGLADAVVRHVRALTGYDRVMVYRFDADGHGAVVAEARDPAREPFLGLHYPASDIPQRARDLYVRNRVRVLVDRDYAPSPLVPRHSPATGAELDMSLCYLRSMSPLHLQYLGNMGVTATLVASIVREGQLWGLIACHHYTPKRVGYDLRAACELLAEVTAMRISVVEGQARAHTELLVRALERRLVRSMVEAGDWREALFGDDPSPLLAPLAATGAALCLDGQLLTTGEVPAPRDLEAIVQWVREQPVDGAVVQSSSLARVHPRFAGAAECASGVLGAAISRADGDFLLWLRKEQVRHVRWAGDPTKTAAPGDDPTELSPRRSFAAWTEQVRHTAAAWSAGDLATAAAIRLSVADMVMQVRALRVLIAERQASQTRLVVQTAGEPMVIADGAGQVLLVNHAFGALVGRPHQQIQRLDDLAPLFTDPARARAVLAQLQQERLPWRGELELLGAAGGVPVAVRADAVPTAQGSVLGYILIATDMSARHAAELTRGRLERALLDSPPLIPFAGPAAALAQDFDALMSAVLANGSAAVMQVADGGSSAAVTPILAELETATRRAAELTVQILNSAGVDARR